MFNTEQFWHPYSMQWLVGEHDVHCPGTHNSYICIDIYSCHSTSCFMTDSFIWHVVHENTEELVWILWVYQITLPNAFNALKKLWLSLMPASLHALHCFLMSSFVLIVSWIFTPPWRSVVPQVINSGYELCRTLL